MVQMNGNLLFSGDNLEENKRTVPTWVLEEYKKYRHTLLGGKDYPCYFAIENEKSGTNYYSYVDLTGSLGTIQDLSSSLSTFLSISNSQPDVLRSLIVFIKTALIDPDFQDYEEQFWKVLHDLHQTDEAPWPENIPNDPNHEKWEFCFKGEPLFIFGTCPEYKNRASRNLCDSLTIVIQSKTIFANISGKRAKEKIRSRVRNYDRIDVHPILGDSSTSSVYKWKQYFLPDHNEDSLRKCPFSNQKQWEGV